MENRTEQHERELRASRLHQARDALGLGGIRKVCQHFGWNENKYKAHESGRNGFGIADAKTYAAGFNVSLQWLYFGIGDANDTFSEPPQAIDVPLISMISAGQLLDQSGVTDFSEFPTVAALDLPDGDWIALRVDGDSMNKISPPGSIIFANLKDRRLAPNACYIVADETGAATYKRYRPNDDPPFQPASYIEDIRAPDFVGAITVIGRVRRSVVDM